MIRIVAANGEVIHEYSTGGVTGGTLLQIASSTKWLTAATFMTFVDGGVIGLDDDISRWLPEFAGSVPPITARQLLDHTSGVHDNPCQDDGTSLDQCVRTLASSPREFPAGTRFSYGNAPFLVVGRLIEVLGGADFASVVRERVAAPLGMAGPTWPGAPSAPNPAFGAQVTVDDYGRLLDMFLHDGMASGTRVLSSDAVHEIVTNQVGDYDTSGDYSVGITQIPRYGLGCWPDVEDASGRTAVVSGNGGKGLYPWVDFTDAHVGRRRCAGRPRRGARGTGVTAGGGGGAHRGQPVRDPVGCRTGRNPCRNAATEVGGVRIRARVARGRGSGAVHRVGENASV